MHTNTTVALKPNFMSSLLYSAVLLKNIHILQSLLKIKIFIIKIPTDLLFTCLVFNAVFIILYHVKAVQDDISAKSVPI